MAVNFITYNTVDGNDYFLSYNRVPCMKVEFF